MEQQVQDKVDANLQQQKVDATSPQVEAQKQPEINKQAEESPKSSKDWEKFREARAAERKQAEEVARQAEKSAKEAEALKAALEAVLDKKQVHSSNDHQISYEDETEDQRIEKKVKIALDQERRRMQEERQKHEQETYFGRILNDHKDFNQVCSTENLDYLDFHYPEVTAAFKHMPEGYDKWSAIYKATKRFIPNTDSRKDQKRVDNNLNKPQSISSPTTTQGTAVPPAMRLDEARKAENWARMQKVMKGLS